MSELMTQDRDVAVLDDGPESHSNAAVVDASAESRQASLVDVAGLAQVSIATVSRVLNNTTFVAENTRRRVLDAVEQVGYTPDPRFRLMGRRSSGKKVETGNLGVLVRSVDQNTFLTDPFFARLYWSLECEASARGKHVTFSAIHNDQHTPPAFIQERQVDGVLIAHSHGSRRLIENIAEIMPVVLVNHIEEDLPLTSIMPDEQATIRLPLEYLKKLGHKRITFFSIDDCRPHNPHLRARARTFTQLTFAEGDLPAARCVVPESRDRPLVDFCEMYLQQWRQNGEMPTAILCAADVYALAFIEACERLKIKIPDELSITGVDDKLECSYVRPGLTTVRQPLEEMGKEAVKVLLEQIDNNDSATVSSKTTNFGVELIKRQSCAKAIEINCSDRKDMAANVGQVLT